jgi:hypothetical protein
MRSVAARRLVCDSLSMMLRLKIPYRLLCLCMALSLPACHLVDQRDFNAQAGVPPKHKVVQAKPVPTVPALVTIRYTEPNPPYQEALTNAVHAALARKPDVLFTVATIVPQAPNLAKSADLGAQDAASGREVAQTIVNAGAAPSQVEQIVSIDPSAAYREVVVRVQ